MKKITKVISTLAVFMFSAAIVGGCGGKEAKKEKPQPAPTTLSCAAENDNFCFVEKADGTYELARYWIEDNAVDKEETIPATFGGKSVTSIGENAFMVYKSKYSMELNNGEFQGEFMYHLRVIRVSEGITELKDYAFKGLANTTWIYLPDSLTKIGHGAFQDTAWQTSNGSTKCTIVLTNLVPPTETDMLGYHKNGEKRIAKTDFGTGVQVRITVPTSAVNTYKTAWPDFAYIIADYWDYTF